MAILAIVAVSIALMLVRPRGLAEFWWIGGGSVLLVVTGLVKPGLAAHAVWEGHDVYAFLIGMMMLSELARAEGVFEWLAAIAVARARGSAQRLFLLVYGIGVVVTTFMSNDATAVVLTPAILAAAKKAKAEPLPHLFACAFVANAASFVLPVSNPANLVVFRGTMPSLAHWVVSFALPSVLAIAVTFALLRWVHRRELAGHVKDGGVPKPLTPYGKATVGGIGFVSVELLASSALGLPLGLPTLLAASVVTIAVCASRHQTPLSLLKRISWSTLLLVGGLFVMVDAMETIGVLAWTSKELARIAELPTATGALIAAGTVGLGNNIVNNLPVGLLVGTTLRGAHAAPHLERALLIGVDLGSNLSITGSLATILWLLALRKEKINVGFFQFLRVGIVVMPLALVAAVLGALLVR